MECILVTLVVIVFVVLIPVARMLFGRGPNNIRRLVRLDLAAFLVLTAGVALALGIVRTFKPLEAACVLVIALPAMIAFAWLARYAIEEIWLGFRRKREQRGQIVDLSYLDVSHPSAGEAASDVSSAPPDETPPR